MLPLHVWILLYFSNYIHLYTYGGRTQNKFTHEAATSYYVALDLVNSMNMTWLFLILHEKWCIVPWSFISVHINFKNKMTDHSTLYISYSMYVPAVYDITRISLYNIFLKYASITCLWILLYFSNYIHLYTHGGRTQNKFTHEAATS